MTHSPTNADDVTVRQQTACKAEVVIDPATPENLRKFADILNDMANKMSAPILGIAHQSTGEVERLRDALKPFAEVADQYDDSEDDSFEVWMDAGPVKVIRASFRLELYRQARAALAIKGGEDAA